MTCYEQEVFRKTSEISKQMFPLTLDIDHPHWRPNLDRMDAASREVAAAKKRGGLGGMLSHLGGMAKAAIAFVAVFTIPVRQNAVPGSPRLQPAY